MTAVPKSTLRSDATQLGRDGALRRPRPSGRPSRTQDRNRRRSGRGQRSTWAIAAQQNPPRTAPGRGAVAARQPHRLNLTARIALRVAARDPPAPRRPSLQPSAPPEATHTDRAFRVR